MKRCGGGMRLAGTNETLSNAADGVQRRVEETGREQIRLNGGDERHSVSG